jgi:hypothetical protein
MKLEQVFAMSFASVYPHYVQKAERKGRKKEEVDEVIRWLTGYSEKALAKQIERKTDFKTFCQGGHRHDLRRAHRGDRSPADAQHPPPGQARGRAGQGQAHGEGPAEVGRSGSPRKS